MKNLKIIIQLTLFGFLFLVMKSCQKETIDIVDNIAVTKEKATDLKLGFTAGKKILKAKELDTKGSLIPRYNHTSLVFNDKMWILGGNVPDTSNDVLFSVDGAHWKTLTEKANFPKRTLFGATVFQSKIWMTGGYGEGANAAIKTKNDVWSSEDGIEWKLVTSDGQFPKRHSHTLTAFNGFLWMIGGVGFNEKANTFETLSDIWRSSNGVNWVQITENAPFGPCRDYAAVVHDNKLWVIGGGNSFGLKDVWYSKNGSQWTKVTGKLPFSPRVLYTVESDGKLMWLIAGYTGYNGQQNDVWYSSNGKDWFQAEMAQNFPVRAQHSSVFFEGKLWVINGAGPNDGSGINPILSDVWSIKNK